MNRDEWHALGEALNRMNGIVTPALSEKEWGFVLTNESYSGHSIAGDQLGVPQDAYGQEISHAAMALANHHLLDSHPGKLTEKDASAIESIARGLARMLTEGQGGRDVLRDVLGFYAKDSDVERLARSYIDGITTTAARIRSLLPPSGGR